MRRGEIWTVSGGSAYTGKPRPAVIVQDDRFDATRSVTICSFTTSPVEAPSLRIPIEPNETNGLREPCRLMIDKITTVPRGRVGRKIGRLAPSDIVRLDRALFVLLGIAGSRRGRRASV
ncbi:MAG TPA: type II toxin-antitoxin system PemK/MazF family toxin [Stellaceae bacterium]|nr:type II toxin-antitoxin system PemK/MazF family toxin [Stellaceae bacterium]